MSRARRRRALTTPLLGVMAVAALMSACGGPSQVAQDKALLAQLQHQMSVDQRGLPRNVAISVCTRPKGCPSSEVAATAGPFSGRQRAVIERVAHDGDALQSAKRQLSRDEIAAQR